MSENGEETSDVEAEYSAVDPRRIDLVSIVSESERIRTFEEQVALLADLVTNIYVNFSCR